MKNGRWMAGVLAGIMLLSLSSAVWAEKDPAKHKEHTKKHRHWLHRKHHHDKQNQESEKK